MPCGKIPKDEEVRRIRMKFFYGTFVVVASR